MFTIKMKSEKDLGTYVRNLNTRIGKRGVATAFAMAKFFQKDAQSNCPVKTGKLRKSIGNPQYGGIWDVSKGGLRIQVGTKVPYAIIVERGVKKFYTIKAKKKSFLRFKINGKWCFAKQVEHPPMPGKFFMRKAAAKTRRNAKRIIGSIK